MIIIIKVAHIGYTCEVFIHECCCVILSSETARSSIRCLKHNIPASKHCTIDKENVLYISTHRLTCRSVVFPVRIIRATHSIVKIIFTINTLDNYTSEGHKLQIRFEFSRIFSAKRLINVICAPCQTLPLLHSIQSIYTASINDSAPASVVCYTSRDSK